jgi:hypothetical protein
MLSGRIRMTNTYPAGSPFKLATRDGAFAKQNVILSFIL